VHESSPPTRPIPTRSPPRPSATTSRSRRSIGRSRRTTSSTAPGGDAVLGERISYADFAIALLDEIEAPAHHRTRIAVSS
jgi:hypothetical protein